jgi:hypothetical protein
MSTTTCKKFNGEIENYLRNGQNNFDTKMGKGQIMKRRILITIISILRSGRL